MASAVSPALFVLPVAATSFTCVRRAVGGGGGMGAGALGSEVSSAGLVQTGPLSSGVSTLGEEGLDAGYPHRVGLFPAL